MSSDRPTVLVVGDERVDAGKTTFSVGLLARLRESGSRPIGFKPRAGNDYWFDHDDALAALEEGRLYGKDVRRLADAASDRPGTRDPPRVERLNPVHRLWRPTPGRTGLLGESDRTALVDRVWTDGEPTYLVNGVAEEEGLLPPVVRRHLPLRDADRIPSLEAFNEAMRDLHLPAFGRLTERVAAADRERSVVIESYGDIAVPLRRLDEAVELDAVAAVAPTRVRVYRGDRWLRARAVASGSPREGRLEERTGRVAEMVEPVATRRLPALPSRVRADPEGIAEAYAEAYDALLEHVKSGRAQGPV
ncbi:MAG: ATPase [Haloferacaceae archaeon]